MENPQYATDLGSQIQGDLHNYHRHDEQDDGVKYDTNQDYMKKDDDPMNQEYHRPEEEEEDKEEEFSEFEEEDKKYDSGEDEEGDVKTGSDDDFRPSGETSQRQHTRKHKSTIEDAIEKAQREIVHLD